MEGDTALADDAVASLGALAERAETGQGVQALLAGEADANDTYVEINAGCRRHGKPGLGGNVACACIRAGQNGAAMKVEVIDYHAGEQAGIKSATLLFKGENAYGYAKTESGVHRLGPHQPL